MKAHRDSNTYLRLAKLESLLIPSTGKNTVQQEHSYNACWKNN